MSSISFLIPLSIIISLTLRILLIPHPYSGFSSPHSLYGDFEAQRHWKEMTYSMGWFERKGGIPDDANGKKWRDYLEGLALVGKENEQKEPDEGQESEQHTLASAPRKPPAASKTESRHGVHHWYRYDLQYWGLDYPPLTAYHSYIMGWIASLVYPEMVQFEASRGIETWQTILFMRCSVLLVDVLLLMPAIYFLVRELVKRLGNAERISSPEDNEEKTSEAVCAKSIVMPLMLILSQPALLLIDNAHFQYNNFSIGLTLWAVYACTRNQLLWGAFLFTLALNYKIIALYYSLPFFFFMLGKCRLFSRRTKQLTGGLLLLLRIGLMVLGTFLLCWAPFLTQLEWKQVLRRIFPFERGLFEDYVANFWCTVQPVLKFVSRRYFQGQPIPHMALISAGFTLTCALPSNLMVFRKPTVQQFLFALSSTSLVFFLTSFHVHEKTILFPLMVISFLIFIPGGRLNRTVIYFSYLAAYSMYPLIVKDALQIAYWALMILFGMVFLWPSISSVECWKRRWALLFMITISFFIQFLISFVPPPPALPYLHVYALTSFSFVGFVLCWLHIVKRQWTDYRKVSQKEHQD